MQTSGYLLIRGYIIMLMLMVGCALFVAGLLSLVYKGVEVMLNQRDGIALDIFCGCLSTTPYADYFVPRLKWRTMTCHNGEVVIEYKAFFAWKRLTGVYYARDAESAETAVKKALLAAKAYMDAKKFVPEVKVYTIADIEDEK